MSDPRAAWVVTHDGRVFNLRKFEMPVRIGRSDDADVVVKNDTVSRLHAFIEWHDDGHHVTDNETANGTRVDGIPLIAGQDAPLTDGSEIMVGTMKLVYFLDGVNAARFAADAANNPDLPDL
ncbi:MAG TPA: FHA domain-containing protein [Kofleriaceae bacterium]